MVPGERFDYNTFMVFDISRQLISVESSLSGDVKKATTTAYTIHQYMYRLAKTFGVLLLMSQSRVEELTRIQDARYLLIEKYLQHLVNLEPGINLYRLKALVQNDRTLDEGLKKEIIGFIKFNETKKVLPNIVALTNWIESYKTFKIDKLRDSVNQEIFLMDYHHVLKNIYQSSNIWTSFTDLI